MKKIVLSCGDGHFNLGDEAITSSIVTNLKKLRKDIDITIFSSDPERTRKLHGTNSIKMEMSFFGFIRGLFSTIKAFHKMDLLIWGGGNLITDAPSQLFTPFHLTKVFLAKLMRKKVTIPCNFVRNHFILKRIMGFFVTPLKHKSVQEFY